MRISMSTESVVLVKSAQSDLDKILMILQAVSTTSIQSLSLCPLQSLLKTNIFVSTMVLDRFLI